MHEKSVRYFVYGWAMMKQEEQSDAQKKSTKFGREESGYEDDKANTIPN